MSYENTKKRAEHEPTIKVDVANTLKHCAGEVVEATEAYSSISSTDNIREAGRIWVEKQNNFADELADIICCVLTICGHENIDIELALTKCMEKNFKRGKQDEAC
jgi:NTP pyrophosphatase (non-canonical NTP hydrolase)